MFRIQFLLAAITLSITSVGQAAEYTFDISDFGFGEWSTTTEVIDDPFVATPGPGFSSAFTNSPQVGGNPGSFRRISKSNFRGDILVISDLYAVATYSLPGSGLESVSFSWDALTASSANDVNTPFVPILVQDGVQYYSLAGVQSVFVDTGWQPLSWPTLSASDFDTNRFAIFDLSPADNVQPDFSPSGSPIHFGYATIGQVLGSPFLSVVNQVDNFSVTFTSAVTIPEPSTVWMITALLATAKLRRRR